MITLLLLFLLPLPLLLLLHNTHLRLHYITLESAQPR